MKQCAGWERAGASVITRPLRYPSAWPRDKAQEKGIDVALAIDFVTMAIEDVYDVGVIGSTDTDLKPAMEYVHTKFHGYKRVEVLNWDGGKKRTRRLSLPGEKIWCHWLQHSDFLGVADRTDYNWEDKADPSR